MTTTYYIGADVHSNSTELAIEKRNKIVARYSVPTTVPAIANVLDSLQGKKYFATEEGPMAGWLFRNLNKKVDKFIVSDPRRNKLISSDGDSDDRIDATKLAFLLRGNYLRTVYHSEDDQIEYQAAAENLTDHGYGPVGLALDPDSEILFVSYERSNIIEMLNAKTMIFEETRG